MNETSNCCDGRVINPSGIGNEGRCADCKEMCAITRTIPIEHKRRQHPISVHGEDADGDAWCNHEGAELEDFCEIFWNPAAQQTEELIESSYLCNACGSVERGGEWYHD